MFIKDLRGFWVNSDQIIMIFIHEIETDPLNIYKYTVKALLPDNRHSNLAQDNDYDKMVICMENIVNRIQGIDE